MDMTPNEKPSRSRQWRFSESPNKERRAVEVPIPMHTGQIIMLTKMMTSDDLRFYEFDAGVPVVRWRSRP